MFLWTVFAYVSARVRVEVFFTLLTDRAFPSAELLGWFEHKPLWQRGQGACSGGGAWAPRDSGNRKKI